ncbi:MAG: hypothetical protein DRR42_18670 [Gammaproteobacteria bacterium]|nr:MAG: hypothetical protein DRR42_18670 [Gammaproteobacteria bacterium]
MLMESGRPEAYRFIPQIEDVRVMVECACGCARIYFVSDPSADIMILASRIFDRPDGGSTHCYVFSVGEFLGGLDAFHYNKIGELEEYPEEAILRKLHLSECQ